MGRDREVRELAKVLGHSMRTVVSQSEPSSALQTQTWPACTFHLHRQGAVTSGLSLPAPMVLPSFFHSVIARGEEETMATQHIGSPPVLEGRASAVQTAVH